MLVHRRPEGRPRHSRATALRWSWRGLRHAVGFRLHVDRRAAVVKASGATRQGRVRDGARTACPYLRRLSGLRWSCQVSCRFWRARPSLSQVTYLPPICDDQREGPDGRRAPRRAPARWPRRLPRRQARGQGAPPRQTRDGGRDPRGINRRRPPVTLGRQATTKSRLRHATRPRTCRSWRLLRV